MNQRCISFSDLNVVFERFPGTLALESPLLLILPPSADGMGILVCSLHPLNEFHLIRRMIVILSDLPDFMLEISVQNCTESGFTSLWNVGSTGPVKDQSIFYLTEERFIGNIHESWIGEDIFAPSRFAQSADIESNKSQIFILFHCLNHSLVRDGIFSRTLWSACKKKRIKG